MAIAQTCHLGLAVQNNIPCELLTGNGPIPQGPDYFGVVIDDFVGISDVPRESREQSHAALKADSTEGVYREVGLQPHEEKAERDVLTGTVWGVHLDRESGIIRGSMKRATPLANIALKVARLGFCTVELAQVLAGRRIL